MHSISSEEPSSSSQQALVLPDGVKKIAEDYESAILQSLRDAAIGVEYISVFQVEPRGDSFLAGFRVGVYSGEEIFIYAEPGNHKGNSAKKNGRSKSIRQLNVWQYPFDPKLKSLASLVNTEPLAIIFSRLEMSFVPSQVELLTYRPGRRAMIKCGDGSQFAFVKSLRPSRVERVVSATRLAKESGIPAPRILGWSSEGFAIFEAIEGIELSRLSNGAVTGDVAINTALGALANINKVKTSVPSRTPIIENHSWYFERAIQAHPAEKSQLKKLKKKIDAVKAKGIDGLERMTIHGDFHLGQVLVSQEDYLSVAGVIDLDDMGLGFFSDDIAAMWSNCVASNRLTTADHELKFWGECITELERTQPLSPRDAGRLHASIAVHLVAQTLSTRGLNPAVAHNLIQDAAKHLG